MSHPSRAHLAAIGIPIWTRRRAAISASPAASPPVAIGTGVAPTSVAPPADVAHAGPGPGADAVPAPAAQPANTSLEMTGSGIAPAPASVVLEAIDAQVRACRKCELHRTRTNTVFGVGRPGVDCMFIGEAPGAEEDARGEPFVGRAGRLLDAMLAAIGLARGDVYIANIVKCRPPGNRDPHAGEIAACSGYLRRQIEAVSPRLLVAAGRVAAQSLLSTAKSIGHLRGRTFRYGEDRLPVVVMYHPAYFLRSPLEKRKAWDDLVRLRSMLSEEAESVP